ncbi:MAG TPA: AEC family transporter, partial [Ardenticatenaceae bacterium]|nr:AEC family transporter [Ardenticatenaceae bacterium]
RTQRTPALLRPLILSTATRLLLGPALGLAATLLLGLRGLSRDVVILESAMPTAVTAIILATEYRADPGFVTTAVFTTTVASLVTVTGVLNLLLP